MSFATRMLDMLTSSYTRTDLQKFEKSEPPETNIGKLFYLAGWGFDILYEQTEKVRLWDDIDKMRGAALDSFGNNYGVVRGMATDEIFRIMIKVKIIAMLASGNLDTLILSAASLFGIRAEDVRCEEVYPAKVYIYINEDELDQEHKEVAETIAGLISRIKSGGIGIRIFYGTYSMHQARIYVGTSVCLSTTINVPPIAINKKTIKNVDLKVGAGTLICATASYPVIR